MDWLHIQYTTLCWVGYCGLWVGTAGSMQASTLWASTVWVSTCGSVGFVIALWVSTLRVPTLWVSTLWVSACGLVHCGSAHAGEYIAGHYNEGQHRGVSTLQGFTLWGITFRVSTCWPIDIGPVDGGSAYTSRCQHTVGQRYTIWHGVGYTMWLRTWWEGKNQGAAMPQWSETARNFNCHWMRLTHKLRLWKVRHRLCPISNFVSILNDLEHMWGCTSNDSRVPLNEIDSMRLCRVHAINKLDSHASVCLLLLSMVELG